MPFKLLAVILVNCDVFTGTNDEEGDSYIYQNTHANVSNYNDCCDQAELCRVFGSEFLSVFMRVFSRRCEAEGYEELMRGSCISESCQRYMCI